MIRHYAWSSLLIQARIASFLRNAGTGERERNRDFREQNREMPVKQEKCQLHLFSVKTPLILMQIMHIFLYFAYILTLDILKKKFD
jgi:hypothetical protein